MTRLAVLTCLCTLIFGTQLSVPSRSQAQTVGRVRYKTYSNARFNYTIAYPANLLVPQPEADNGDGRRFLSRDGRAELIVFGRHALDDSLQKLFEEALRGEAGSDRTVTLKTIRRNWFVVSGRERGKIFYRKTIQTGDVFKTFIIEYDESQKATYDPMTARIASSFTG